MSHLLDFKPSETISTHCVFKKVQKQFLPIVNWAFKKISTIQFIVNWALRKDFNPLWIWVASETIQLIVKLPFRSHFFFMSLKLQITENANSKTISTQSSSINIWAYDVTLLWLNRILRRTNLFGLRSYFPRKYTIPQQQNQLGNRYRTRAIITRSLYSFYPFFEVQKRFFNSLFSCLRLCMVSIQERVMMACIQ